MGKYVFIYTGRPDPSGDPGAVTASWQRWFDGLGSAVVDAGNPFAAGKTVASDGAVSDGTPLAISGYSIVQAHSLDAAAALASGCPGLANAQIEVYETVPFPSDSRTVAGRRPDTAFAEGSVADASVEFAPLAQRSTEIVEQIRDHDWDGLTADWDETMRTKLPVEQVAEVWQQLSSSAGALQALGPPSIVRKGPFRIAEVPLVFEHGPMKARITFNHDNSVAGLFILLPDAE
ncbi:MAG: DUF3887 domain-containing protein [Solirubrobacteraceae bacterium]